jgi:hypothetical protein
MASNSGESASSWQAVQLSSPFSTRPLETSCIACPEASCVAAGASTGAVISDAKKANKMNALNILFKVPPPDIAISKNCLK